MSELKKENLEAFVEEFADGVEGQAKAVLTSDVQKGTECAHRYMAAVRSLQRLGNEGRDALATLLNDRRSEVRVQAASYLLKYSGEQARLVLEREASGRGFTAFTALQVLKRWNEGTWNLDPLVD